MAFDRDFEQSIYSHQETAASPAGSLFESFAERSIRRVQDTIAELGTAGPQGHKVLRRQHHLLKIMLSHVGREKAVPLTRLAELLTTSVREVKGDVQDLRRNFGIQIGASRDAEQGGYYLITNDEESKDSARQLIHQAVSMLRTARALRSEQTIAELLGQVRIKLEDPNV